mmetsp:Transcript_14530/g.25669  ORF Transcript_14530/g.25669 Transcript_14530/m.25669 type:complete len:381 (+) Transcript_14530:129-1271(+)
MAQIDLMATRGDEIDNRFKSRQGAWFDWTMDEEEPQEDDMCNRFKSQKGAWFDWSMDEEEHKPGDCDVKKEDDSSINWADPRAWEKARTTGSSKPCEIKAPVQSASRQEHEESPNVPDVSAAVARTSEKSRKRSKQSAKTQRVVWCHEHCHKSHNDVWRKTLWRTCREHEASLVCHKKAAKFEAWLSCAKQPDYILVTDWREAKPCMEVISKGFKYAQMIVYCEAENTFRKATEWVKNLPPLAGPVCVVNGMEEVNAYLLESFAKELTTEAEVCLTPSTISECEGEPQANGLDTETTDQSEDEAMWSPSGVSFAPKADQVWVPCVPMLVPLIQVVAPVVAPVAAPAVNPIANVLGPVLSTYSAQDLSQALAEAMPDCYAD